METLKEYVLVGSQTKTIEVFRRDEVGTWTFIPYGEGDRVELTSVNLVISVDAIYEDFLKKILAINWLDFLSSFR